MRKMCGPIVLIFTLGFALGAAYGAPPTAVLPVSGTQSQMSSEALSPEARQKLIKKVSSAIVRLPNMDAFDNIDFRLEGRTVILQGQVAHSNLKPDAENAVKKIEGVDKVVNNIEVLPPSPVDDRLRRQVYNAIYNYGPFFKYKNNQVNPPIRILVKNSRVTLEGVVDNETDKGQATMRVNQVPGVLSVTNDLRVVKPS
jgi:hyperosmotically inducible protein